MGLVKQQDTGTRGDSVKPLNVALIGARGIGRVHAQLLAPLGAQISAVLGSTQETAALAAEALARDLGRRPQAFSQLEELLDMPDLDAVSICSPPHLHFDHLLASFERAQALPAFCEKPLFWQRDLTPAEVQHRIDRLASHPYRRLFMNTSTGALLDSIRTQLPRPEDIETCGFRYDTQGRYRGKDIAADLLPHGLAFILHLLGDREMTALSQTITPSTYHCHFRYGHCLVQFDFQEQADGPKALAFAVNGRGFTRIQEGSGAAYRLFVQDDASGKRIAIENPLSTYLARFVTSCRSSTGGATDAFEEAAVNMQLMARMLL